MGVLSGPRLLVAGSAAVGVLLLAMAACGGGGGFDSAGGITIVTRSPTPTPAETPTPTATAATPSPTPTPNVCVPSDAPATPEEMQVLEPRLAESQEVVEVRNPLRVSGWGSQIARTGVAVGLVGKEAQVLAYVAVTPLPAAGQVPPPGLTVTAESAPFAVDIPFTVLPFPVSEATPVCLWVFQQMATGDPYNVVQVPLILMP